MSSTTSLESMKEQMVPENEVEQVRLLNGVEDSYEGIIVEIKEHMDSRNFVPILRASISQWKQQEGFRYHHAEPEYLMLVRWLPNSPDTLPANASHRVGIGAFIVNNKREVLVIQENSGGFKGTGVWKLPTGVVNEGEDICEAAIREVKEETGIEAEFIEILAFRQSHHAFFGKSDLFFVCMLQPHSFNIRKQDSEVEAAQWMPIEDYLNQPYNKEHQLFQYVAEICKTKSEGDYVGFPAIPIATASNKKIYLYFNNRDFNRL
ncbi:nudix hydrolase 2 isoform X2 [Hevea brasiliensis]|uniref:nudix hydrolase 2 isoform X2 n=1 Tax=Hevea brasiliensis TaxID=3981 RepID=UPI0025D95FA0|nr:nudix hydrolase 2 isoform X2 [Hevea brasiliensis]